MIQWHSGARRVETLAFSPDGRTLASATYQGEVVKLWHPAGTPAGRRSVGSRVLAVTFSPCGRFLAVAAAHTPTVVFDAAGEAVATLGDGGAADLAYTPDGSALLALASPWVWVWADPHRPADRRTPDAAFDSNGPGFFDGSSLAVAADGRTVVVNGDTGCTAWDAATGAAVRAVPHPTAGFIRTRVAVSASGRVAATYGKHVSCWSLADPAPPVTLPGPTASRSVRGLGFTPAGGLLAVGSDGVARLWDADAGTERDHWDFGLKNLQGVAVSPDGLTAAAGGHDGTIVV